MSNGILERKAHLIPLHPPLCEAGICSFILIFNKSHFREACFHSEPAGDAQVRLLVSR